MPDQHQQLPADFLERLKLVTGKRPKAVINHILEHGFVTTEELTMQYGYEHAPRAARDVREEGIPLETFRVKNSSGRSIGAYRFGDLSLMRKDRVGGRVAFSKKFKQEVAERDGLRCAVCSTAYEDRYLQVDHRVPYEFVRLVTEQNPGHANTVRIGSWRRSHQFANGATGLRRKITSTSPSVPPGTWTWSGSRMRLQPTIN